MLREQTTAFSDSQLLSSCYQSRSHLDTNKLCQYYDVFRSRVGHSSILAASLVIFDLAKQGHFGAQREFELIAYESLELENRDQLALDLIEDCPYLNWLWLLCKPALDSIDPRLSAETVKRTDSGVFELDILEEDVLDEDIVEDEQLIAKNNAVFFNTVKKYFDFSPDPTSKRGTTGFYATTRADVERVENLISDLQPLRNTSPLSQGMLTLAELFLASHLRIKTLWGRPNKRRMELVSSGLKHFLQSSESIFVAARYFAGRDADLFAWPKVCQLLMDFSLWLKNEWQGSLRDAPRSYAEAARQLPRIHLDDRRSAKR